MKCFGQILFLLFKIGFWLYIWIQHQKKPSGNGIVDILQLKLDSLFRFYILNSIPINPSEILDKLN